MPGSSGAALLLPPLALGCIYGAWIFFGPTWDAVVGGRWIALTPDALQGRVPSVIRLVAAGAVALGPLAPSLATLERRVPAATVMGT